MKDLRKYAERLCGKENVIYSPKSNYYKFGKGNGNTLRISDHTGPLSSGRMSIIETENDDVYVVHHHATGNLTVVNYRKAQELIRNFSLMSQVFEGNPNVEIKVNPNTVMGIEISKFNENDRKSIIKLVKANKNSALKNL